MLNPNETEEKDQQDKKIMLIMLILSENTLTFTTNFTTKVINAAKQT